MCKLCKFEHCIQLARLPHHTKVTLKFNDYVNNKTNLFSKISPINLKKK